MRPIDADALREEWLESGENEYVYDTNAVLYSIDSAPTLDVQPVRRGEWGKVMTVDIAVTHTELKHLINDTIAYTWKLEDRGIADEAHGYNSRKVLLAKLQEIERENFPENSVTGG